MSGEYSKMDKRYIYSKDKNGNLFFPEKQEIKTLFQPGGNDVKFCAVHKDGPNQSDSCKAYMRSLALFLDVPESKLVSQEMDSMPRLDNEIYKYPIDKERRNYLNPYKEALDNFNEQVSLPKEVRFHQDNLSTRNAITIKYTNQ